MDGTNVKSNNIMYSQLPRCYVNGRFLKEKILLHKELVILSLHKNISPPVASPEASTLSQDEFQLWCGSTSNQRTDQSESILVEVCLLWEGIVLITLMVGVCHVLFWLIHKFSHFTSIRVTKCERNTWSTYCGHKRIKNRDCKSCTTGKWLR